MSTSRRAFLQTAAAVPAAGVAAGLVGSVPVVEAAIPVAAPALPAFAYPFQWWVSSDGGEVYHTDCNTREEAMQVAKEYGGGLIAECQQQDFDLGLSGDTIIEALYGQNEEMMGEDSEFIECTHEQEKELGEMVTAAIVAWANKNNIKTTAWIFGVVRNKEEIIVAEPISYLRRDHDRRSEP